MGYHVIQCGAAGDGKTNDAAAIQKAIDLCCQEGGGKVILDGGHTYLSGSIVLKQGVELVGWGRLDHCERPRRSSEKPFASLTS